MQTGELFSDWYGPSPRAPRPGRTLDTICIYVQVPTRTLIQIRTHAQKYFNKLGIDSGSQAAPRTSDEELMAPQSFEAPSAGAFRAMALLIIHSRRIGAWPLAGQAVVAAGVRLQPFATLRHVLLEPVHPTDTLGLRLGGSTAGGVTIEAFLPILTSAPLAGPSPVTAEITGPGVSRPVRAARARFRPEACPWCTRVPPLHFRPPLRSPLARSPWSLGQQRRATSCG